MNIKLTPLELKQMIIWANNTIFGGHRGDMNVIIPEEEILLKKLNETDGLLEISHQEANLLKIWAENAIGGSLQGMTSEEITLINKIKNSLL